ncbi:hypothetical protein QUA41_27735 [Microcoleus sp. Pol11C1]|uniref:hypothetical protein n=1 Tax=unclassified Microcoleus TaxID=2642155 RepID=UPI002FD495C4
MRPFQHRILAHVPDRFLPQTKSIILVMVRKTYTKGSDLKKEVEDAIELFEAEGFPLAVCPKCEGWGCNYCNFEGAYDPSEKEPDSTN